MSSTPVRTRAFTLIELLVVVAVIGVLLGVLLPSLAASRRQAQRIECQSNQRQLAVGLTTHSVDHDGLYCTGPSDNRTDRGYGAIDKKGWLADLVNGDIAKPNELLCPTHPGEVSQNLSLARLNDSPFKPFDEVEQSKLLQRGYNSNYTISWYTAYSQVKDVYSFDNDPKRTSGVRGPLHTKFMNKIAPTFVPLLATGRTDVGESFPIDGEVRRAVKALTDGPMLRNGRWDRQDYDDWGPAHGEGTLIASGDAGHNRKVANVAFADGHVRSFKDTVHDGEFGVEVVPGPNGGTYARYEDDDFEDHVFGGWLLTGQWLRGRD